MNKARIIIPTPQEAADRYGVSQSWVSELVTRFKNEGEAAFDLKSQRPHTSPNKLRKTPEKIPWGSELLGPGPSLRSAEALSTELRRHNDSGSTLAVFDIYVLTTPMKITYQITGSIALVLWALILFIPDFSTGATAMITDLTWYFSGKKFVSFRIFAEFLTISVVLVGYAIFAFRSASRRERG
jgi:hypothetical protein